MPDTKLHVVMELIVPVESLDEIELVWLVTTFSNESTASIVILEGTLIL